MNSQFKNTLLVARYTAKEIYQSRVMFNIPILGCIILLASWVSAEFTYGAPQKVALDLGLGTLTIAAVGISIFLGVNLLSSEIESRTVYMIVTRPVSRAAFLVGRFSGMSFILFINSIILGILSLVVFFSLGGHYEPLIPWSLLFAYFESLLVLCVVLFFSLITNSVMSVIYTIFIFIFSHAINGMEDITMVKKSVFLQKFLSFLNYILPNLGDLNIKQFLLYKKVLGFEYLGLTLLHSLLYAAILLMISSLIFERKNLD